MKPDEIPDEIVQATLLPWHRHIHGGEGDCDCLKDPEVVAEYRKDIRHTLAAVWPLIAREVLQDAADALARKRAIVWSSTEGAIVTAAADGFTTWHDEPEDGFPSVPQWLRARAAALAPEGEKRNVSLLTPVRGNPSHAVLVSGGPWTDEEASS